MKIADEIEQAFREGLVEGEKNKGDRDERIKQIANHYGFTNQANMLVEESAEFTQAVCKLRRGNIEAYENIKEELADVIIIAKQLRHLLGADQIDKIIDSKLNRQIERMREEMPNNGRIDSVCYGDSRDYSQHKSSDS